MKRRLFFFISVLFFALNVQLPPVDAMSSAGRAGLEKNLVFVLPGGATRGESQFQNLSDGGNGKAPLRLDFYQWMERVCLSQTLRHLERHEFVQFPKSPHLLASWSSRGPPFFRS